MRLLSCSLLVAVAALTSACGSAVGCDFRPDEDRCQERSNFQQFGFGQFCEGLGDESVEGGCPDDGKVLGCDMGGDVVDWYYAPMTREEAEAECADDDATVLEP